MPSVFLRKSGGTNEEVTEIVTYESPQKGTKQRSHKKAQGAQMIEQTLRMIEQTLSFLCFFAADLCFFVAQRAAGAVAGNVAVSPNFGAVDEDAVDALRR